MRCFRERKNCMIAPPDSTNPALIILDSPPMPGAIVDLAPSGFRLFLDPQKRFMPVVLEQTRFEQGKIVVQLRREVNEFKKLSNGVFVPVRFTTTVFDRDSKQTYGEPVQEAVVVVDSTRSSWNASIPDKVLQLSFPAGVKVSDQIRKANYVVGKNDPGENIKGIVTNAREYVDLSGSPTHPDPPPRSRFRLYVGTSLGVLSLVVALMILRSRARRVPL